MRLFGFIPLPRMRRRPWMRWPLMLLGLLIFGLAVWFGGPMTGWAPLATVFWRVTIIGTVVGIFFVYQFIRWMIRRRKARELEDAIVPPEPIGDAKVLAERMDDALATLKKSGGRTYLYDLPWYIIIGPPGAGKTTALRNSGIEFPLAEAEGGVVEGFGGTRNCDWWFAEDAILIDTAGRYTTQDSDREADETSWKAFLNLLKKGRSKQPINGVLLAFSAEDMMTATEDQIAHHATTVRARLAEIHETLRIDFPVYVLFTKADLVAGFREYFSSFSQARRKSVWGVTFQTKDRGAQTWQQVPDEYDALIARLSDEVIDRMNEEPDGISRIAIFGLPGQMASIRTNVADFLRRVFEPTRYKTNAILRGFYFTSGTQEGTPIDQVLGAISRNSESGLAFQPSFMSGRGKSYFLHDLLKKVIFEERDWVSHDEKAVRRSLVLRTMGFSAIGVATAALLAAFGYSYWQNASLVRTANAEAGRYAREHAQEIAREVIDDPDLRPVIRPLQDLRIMSAGYGTAAEPVVWEKFGLSQHRRLNAASNAAYSDALERMLRPRLILRLERDLQRLRSERDVTGVYRALKVYMLLGGAGERQDDEAIKAYFANIWRNELTDFSEIDARDQLNAHLEAMLELDDERDPLVGVVTETVTAAQEAIVQLPLADQAYATIVDRIGTTGLPDFNLVERVGPNASLVFQTNDGSSINELGVPALYTYEGFWAYFSGETEVAREQLRADQWVFGEAGDRVDFDRQLAGLERTLMSMYQREFYDAWYAMFDRLELAPMAADKPNYDALAAAAAPTASPILDFVEAVTEETRLTRMFEIMANLSAEDITNGNAANMLGSRVFQRMRSGQGFWGRTFMDMAGADDKFQERVGGGAADGPQRSVELIAQQFRNWHDLLEGEVGRRPIDVVLSNLGNIRDNLRISGGTTGGSDIVLQQLLSALTSNNSQLPEPLARLLNDAEADFRSDAEDASLAEMNRVLNDDIFLYCRESITSFYPFANNDRPIAPGVFGGFFGPGGRMDNYFTQYIAPHVSRTPDGFVVREDSPMAGRLSPTTLAQFERAERIREAFFASGSAEPAVTMFVTHVSSHSSIREAVLMVNGTVVTSRQGDPAQRISWPGDGISVQLQFVPQNRESVRNFRGGRWAIVDFFRSAVGRQVDANRARITHEIGGRPITYQFEFESNTVPFLMRELGEFDCPASLD